MLIDKEGKTVIAKNQEEAHWYNSAEQTKQMIKLLKHRIKRAKEDLKLSARVIEKKFKEGAKAQIKADKSAIKIQKKLLKFYESQLN